VPPPAARFNADKLNQAKNLCNNAVKNKMKAKEPQGDADAAVPAAVTAALTEVDAAACAALTVQQLKKLSKLLDEEKVRNEAAMVALDETRTGLLRSVGNVLGDDVPRFKEEDHNTPIKFVGDCGPEFRQKYSHVDLIEMINGVDVERGAVTAGNRVRRCRYPFRTPGPFPSPALLFLRHA